jgi:putative oxidoreductase
MFKPSQYLLSQLIAALFILLFAYTALDKLLHIKQFIFYLRNFSLFAFAPVFSAWSVVFVEMIIVCFLFFNSTRRIGFLASLCLMLVFTLFIGYMLVTFEKLPCSCGGIIKQLSWRDHLIANLVFTGLAGIGWYLQTKGSFAYKTTT